jgi:glycogen debranching enzyme
MARTGEVPFGRYYGSVDATPLFVILAGRYYARTADLETIRKIWPNIVAALAWIDGPGDADRDGFVEYRARSAKSLGNQGWKDSFDSIMHEDGSLAEGAIALCEVQAYVHLAKLMAANLADALAKPEVALRLRREADALRVRFEARFWCEEIGAYALALDGDKRPCRVRSSNTGQVLFGEIASPERARRVAQTLMRKESFSGWGVRTLAAGERRFNPMSYHNGSVWPHDNSLIALGLSRYGLKDPVLGIFRGLFESVHYLDDMRLPELFCGFSRRKGQAPTRYPVACSPQAWASATLPALIDAMLGIEIDPLKRELRFRRPSLPPEIGQLRLNALQVGDEFIDVIIERHGETVSVNALNRSAAVRILMEP